MIIIRKNANILEKIRALLLFGTHEFQKMYARISKKVLKKIKKYGIMRLSC